MQNIKLQISQKLKILTSKEINLQIDQHFLGILGVWCSQYDT